MAKDIYRRLQQRLDLYSLGFPATASEVEIEILKTLFSEEDASVFLKLTHLLEPPEAVAGTLGLSVAEAREKLADMAARGLLFSKKFGDETRYGTTPFVHGIYEFQTSRMTPELARLMERHQQPYRLARQLGLQEVRRLCDAMSNRRPDRGEGVQGSAES